MYYYYFPFVDAIYLELNGSDREDCELVTSRYFKEPAFMSDN